MTMRVTLEQIAKLADVSRGTVDRVLHNRPGVNKAIRERVEYILAELNYTPNLAGKALNSKTQYQLGVVLAPDFNPFVDMVKKGVADAARNIESFGFKLATEVVNAFNVDEELEILDKLEKLGVDGIAIVPVNHSRISEKINDLSERGIPVVTFNSDIKDSKRLCFVGQDNYKAGRTAAALLEGLMSKEEETLVITSSKDLVCHQDRTNGFIARIGEGKKRLKVVDIAENADKDEVTFNLIVEAMRKHESLGGIYLTGGGAAGLGKALKILKRTEIFVVCHDFVDPVVTLLKENIIDFAIGQNPYQQGYLPLQMLFNYIIMKEKPERDVFYTGIDVRLAENIDLDCCFAAHS